jgi:nucleoside-diphosphate-sugar epimerase
LKYTVLGAGGFIGSELTKALQSENGAVVYAPLRKNISHSLNDILKRELGHLFYCIGLTANFREKPFDTVEAHVCLLNKILEYGQFDSLTYLSSTRVYEGAEITDESATLQVSPSNPENLYNLSKLLGESLCIASGRRTRIARLSNVYSHRMMSKSFLSQILTQAVNEGYVKFMTTENSAKDYVSIIDVVRWLPKIAVKGAKSIYNIASGKNVSNEDIASFLNNKGVTVNFSEDAHEWVLPVIDTRCIENEFGKPQFSLINELEDIYDYMKSAKQGV